LHMRPFWANAVTGACLLIALGYAGAAWPDEIGSPALTLDDMTFVASLETENEVVLVAEQATVESAEKLAHLETVHLVVASGREIPGLDMISRPAISMRRERCAGPPATANASAPRVCATHTTRG
jgi:hypothetical protein